MSLKNKKIGFIGGGNMAEALIAGLLTSRSLPSNHLLVFDPSRPRQRHLQRSYGVRLVRDNGTVMACADTVVLAVKPQILPAVLSEIRPKVGRHHLVISIAAGVDTSSLHRHLGKRVRLIRTMPNTPACLRKGITGLYPAPSATVADKRQAAELFASVGAVVWLRRERDLDWVTALSGSGPAYLYSFLESLVTAGMKGGLSQKTATQLALATVQGGVALAAASKEGFAKLRAKVTSKGGTTEAALAVLKQRKWGSSLVAAVKAAAGRAKELRGQK